MRLLTCLTVALALAGHGQTGTRTLQYVESSNGLGQPRLDGGTTEVEMVDINADGNIDLISVGDHGNPFVNTNQHGIIVWFGNGFGGWSVAQTGNFGYGGIAAGDVDGDGDMDVAYGVHHDWGPGDLGDQILEVALGDGSGTEWIPWDDGLATNGETWGMSGTDLADVDGDGDLDVGSISFGCCAGLHVYLNQGDGSWVQSFGNLGGNSNSEFTFGDVDGDGWPDFAASHDSGTVWIGDGTGAFRRADGNLPGGGAFNRAGISLGDIDGDGRDELAWADSAGALQVWSWGAGDIWTDRSGALPSGGNWDATQLWDMDGDGLLDLAAFGRGRFGLWLGDGGGGWTESGGFSTPSPGHYEAFRVGGDVDHNGFPDIVQVADEGGTFNSRNVIRVFRESTPAAVRSARLVSPATGAMLRGSSARFIEWASSVPAEVPSRVRLGYSFSGPEGPWTLIGEGLPNNGRHQWEVPSVAAPAQITLGMVLLTPDNKLRAVSQPIQVLPGN